MKTYLLIAAVILLCLILFNACKTSKTAAADPVITKDVWLNSHRPDPTPDMYSARFPLDTDAVEWEEMKLPIEGFTYVAGQIYHLQVEELGADDAGQMQYRLVKTISQTPDKTLLISDIYVLSDIAGEMKATDFKDVRCMIELNAKERTIAGEGLCNRFSGSIKSLTESEISFGPVMATKMACPQLQIEQMVFKKLAQVAQYERIGLQLLLKNDMGEALMTLNKVD